MVPAGRLWVMGDHRALAGLPGPPGRPGRRVRPGDQVIGRAFVIVGRSRTPPSWRSRRRSRSRRCSPMATEAPPAPAPAKKGGFLRDTAVVLIVALLLSVLTRTFLVQAFYVPSGSMLPTLQLQDRILASKLTGGDVQRGDIVVFADPGGWLPPAVPVGGVTGAVRTALTWVGLLPSDADDNLVKRVIGLGGDRVVRCDSKNRIEVNGSPLIEPDLAPGGTDQVHFDIVVPSEHMFVMGRQPRPLGGLPVPPRGRQRHRATGRGRRTRGCRGVAGRELAAVLAACGVRPDTAGGHLRRAGARTATRAYRPPGGRPGRSRVASGRAPRRGRRPVRQPRARRHQLAGSSTSSGRACAWSCSTRRTGCCCSGPSTR